jgi:2-keto-3-deoxy-L-rhamnonate aldolase RhmA
VAEALDQVIASCKDHNRIPAIYANTLALASNFAARGFRLIAAGQ